MLTRPHNYTHRLKARRLFRSNIHVYPVTWASTLPFAASQDTRGPLRLPTATRRASLMRTGPGVFDPAASSQPCGPISLMPIQQSPHPLQWLPHCLGYSMDPKQKLSWAPVWYQSWLRWKCGEGRVGKKKKTQQFSSGFFFCRFASSSSAVQWSFFLSG